MNWIKRQGFEVFFALITALLLGSLIYTVWLGADPEQKEALKRVDMLVKITGYLVVTIAILLFYKRMLVFEKKNLIIQQQLEATKKQEIDKRVVDSIKLIGSSNISVQIGGLHAMDNLFGEAGAERHKETLYNSILSYVRSSGAEEKEKLKQASRFDIVSLEHAGILTALKIFFGNYDEKEGTRVSAYTSFKQVLIHLPSAYLVHGDLQAADLSKSNLRGATLDRAMLFRTNFSEADLREARLNKAYASGATFTDANLLDANFFKANLYGANLTRAHIASCIEDAILVTEADVTGLILLGKKPEDDAKGIDFVEWSKVQHIDQIERNDSRRLLLKERYPKAFEMLQVSSDA